MRKLFLAVFMYYDQSSAKNSSSFEVYMNGYESYSFTVKYLSLCQGIKRLVSLQFLSLSELKPQEPYVFKGSNIEKDLLAWNWIDSAYAV